MPTAAIYGAGVVRPGWADPDMRLRFLHMHPLRLISSYIRVYFTALLSDEGRYSKVGATLVTVKLIVNFEYEHYFPVVFHGRYLKLQV